VASVKVLPPPYCLRVLYPGTSRLPFHPTPLGALVGWRFGLGRVIFVVLYLHRFRGEPAITRFD